MKPLVRVPMTLLCLVLPSVLALTSLAVAQSPTATDGLTAEDWDGIRSAFEADRHLVVPLEDGGFQARNPGQGWRTRFDGRGFLTKPDNTDWTWGLELVSYGFAGCEQHVTKPMQVSAVDQRVAYAWDAILEEWYVNDTRGLEHGYTVNERPPLSGDREEEALIFTLSVRGGLEPEVAAGGGSVRFLDENGAAALTYSGLRVYDFEERELEASFERVGDRLRLHVDEQGARYPLTIDPLAQQAYLKASNTNPHDHFGGCVAVSGDTVVVGAPGEDSNAVGVNGDQSDNSAADSGAVYVFVRSGVSWTQQAYIKASNPDPEDSFGYSVAVSGDVLVVGARGEASNATGVNGNQGDNSAPKAGAAYVFVRNGTSWSQEAYLKASNTDAEDWFGKSVAVSGETVVVGAYLEDSSAKGVDGNQGNGTNSDNSGAAYVFVRSGSSWSQEAYLKASNTHPLSLFGHSTSVSGDTALIGAWGEWSNATGVNGNQNNTSMPMAGAAYVFVRNGTSWSQEAYLKASNTDQTDSFGFSVSLSDDTAVVSAPLEQSNATGVNGDQQNNSLSGAGAAYVFSRNGTSWSQEAYLKASNTYGQDWFGQSVAVSGDRVLVGAHGEDGGAGGVNGDQGDNSAPAAGAAYAFARRGLSWTQQAYLKASNPGPADYFGWAVAISGDTALAGAWVESSNATGVNGDQSDDSAVGAGAAYVFDLDEAVGQSYCFGDAGSGTPCPCNNDNDGSVPGSGCSNGVFASGAQLSGSGVPSVSADSLVLTTTGVASHAQSLFSSQWNWHGRFPLRGSFRVPFPRSPRVSWNGTLHARGALPHTPRFLEASAPVASLVPVFLEQGEKRAPQDVCPTGP